MDGISWAKAVEGCPHGMNFMNVLPLRPCWCLGIWTKTWAMLGIYFIIFHPLGWIACNNPKLDTIPPTVVSGSLAAVNRINPGTNCMSNPSPVKTGRAPETGAPMYWSSCSNVTTCPAEWYKSGPHLTCEIHPTLNLTRWSQISSQASENAPSWGSCRQTAPSPVHHSDGPSQLQKSGHDQVSSPTFT